MQKTVRVDRTSTIMFAIAASAIFISLVYVVGGFTALHNLLQQSFGGVTAEAQVVRDGLNPTPDAATCPATLPVAAPAGATDITATNFGANQTLNAGNYFSTNPITVSATLTINGAVNIYAPKITVTGSIVGTGHGPAGGARANIATDTNNGLSGDPADVTPTPNTQPNFPVDYSGGMGGNKVNPDGAGGGGYGGKGGGAITLNGGGRGGLNYGASQTFDIQTGSGGGGGNCGAGTPDCGGGDGGSALALYTRDLAVPGTITVNGTNGGNVNVDNPANVGGPDNRPIADAGAGGSGGGILLSAWNINVTGTLRSIGGNGGNATGGDSSNDDAGAGGAGGRIKIFHYNNYPTNTVSPATVDVSGGGHGTQVATNLPEDGARGSYAIGACAGPQLSVTKVASADPVRPGQTYTYTVTVTNPIDVAVQNVVVSDDYDQSKVQVTNLGDFASDNGDVLTATPFSLNPGQSRALTYTVQVRNPYPAVNSDSDKHIVNTVTVTADDVPPIVIQKIVNVILLQIAKSLDPNTLVDQATKAPGSLFSMYVAMQNDSLIDLNGNTVTDDLSAAFNSGIVLSVSQISNGGVFDANTKVITWSGVDLPSGGAATQRQFSFALQVASHLPNATNTITNNFVLHLAGTSPVDITSNTVTVQIPALPNIVTNKSAFVNAVPSTGAAHPGDALTFSIQYLNNGSLDASNFTLLDNFFNSTVTIQKVDGTTTSAVASSLFDMNTLVVNNGGSKDAQNLITWPIGTLSDTAPQASVSFQATLLPTFPIAGNYTFTNVATYDYTVGTTHFGGQTNTNQILVPALPIISIAKCINPGCVTGNQSNPGAQLLYQVNVLNSGNVAATNTIVTDPFDGLGENYLAYQTASPAPQSTAPLTWNLGTLNPQQTKTITLTSQISSSVPAGETRIENDAQVDTAETPLVNSNIVVTTLQAQSALTIVKAVDKSIANPGDPLTYTVTVQNVGNLAAQNVVVSDPMTGSNRDYLDFVSATPAPSNPDPKNLTWTFATINPGETKTITIQTTIHKVMPLGTTTIADTAIITSTVPPMPSNQVVTVVTATTNLTIIKAVDKSSAAPGDTIVYTLTYSNNGTADAANVTISDPFTNTNQQYLTLTKSEPALTVPSSHILNLATLAAGATGSLKLTATIGANVPCTPPSSTIPIEDQATLEQTGSAALTSNKVTTTVTATCKTPVVPVAPKTGRGTTALIVLAALLGAGAATAYVGSKMGWFKKKAQSQPLP